MTEKKKIYVNVGRDRTRLFDSFDQAVQDYVDSENEYRVMVEGTFGMLGGNWDSRVKRYAARQLVNKKDIWKRAYELERGD